MIKRRISKCKDKCIAINKNLKKEQDMESSDSEGDSENKLREAIDQEFISNIFEEVNGGKEKVKNSLRPHPVKPFKNELKVTPEFQKYVAKHLDLTLKRQIKEVSVKDVTPKSLSDDNNGIRLFSNSKFRIRSCDLEREISTQNINHRKRKKVREGSNKGNSSDESDDNLERIRSVAVSPEWVLEKKGVFGKCCEKGKVIRLIDEGNGHLVEKVTEFKSANEMIE